jgi:hypothetical protein
MNDPLIAWQTVAAEIFVQLGRDKHLAGCELAKAGGPDATLACAECGRALWMHSTRHDTCGQFCWVTERTLTDRQIGLLGTSLGLPDKLRAACHTAFQAYLANSREAKQTCAAAINQAKAALYREQLATAQAALGEEA